MRRALLLMLPVAVVGVIGGLVAIAARESDANFVFRQQHSSTIEPRQVERLVMRAREPVPGNNGTAAVRGTCTPGKVGERRNPWSCRIRYGSGRIVVYRLEIAPDGSFQGSNPTGERVVRGCCVAVPKAE
jgi:hypothetical protein